MTLGFFLVELIVGITQNSVALLADSFHMLSDVMALIVGLVAVRYQKKQNYKDNYTFGYLRAEVVGGLCNSVFLIALCFTIILDAVKHLFDPERMENPVLVLIVGGIGLLINLVGLFMFSGSHGHSHGGGSDSHGHSHGGSHSAGHDNHAMENVEGNEVKDSEPKAATKKESNETR